MRPNDIFAGKDGNAYKRGSDGGWQQHGRTVWNKATSAATGVSKQP